MNACFIKNNSWIERGIILSIINCILNNNKNDIYIYIISINNFTKIVSKLFPQYNSINKIKKNSLNIYINENKINKNGYYIHPLNIYDNSIYGNVFPSPIPIYFSVLSPLNRPIT